MSDNRGFIPVEMRLEEWRVAAAILRAVALRNEYHHDARFLSDAIMRQIGFRFRDDF